MNLQAYYAELYANKTRLWEEPKIRGAVELLQKNTPNCDVVTPQLREQVYQHSSGIVSMLDEKNTVQSLSTVTMNISDSVSTISSTPITITTVGASFSVNEMDFQDTSIGDVKMQHLANLTDKACEVMADLIESSLLTKLSDNKTQVMPDYVAAGAGYGFSGSTLTINLASQAKGYYLQSIRTIMNSAGFRKPIEFIASPSVMHDIDYAATFGANNNQNLEKYIKMPYLSSALNPNYSGGIRANGYAFEQGAVGWMKNVEPIFNTPYAYAPADGDKDATFYYTSLVPMPYINDSVMIIEKRNVIENAQGKAKLQPVTKYALFYSYALVTNKYIQTAGSEKNNILYFTCATT